MADCDLLASGVLVSFPLLLVLFEIFALLPLTHPPAPIHQFLNSGLSMVACCTPASGVLVSIFCVNVFVFASLLHILHPLLRFFHNINVNFHDLQQQTKRNGVNGKPGRSAR